MRLAAVRAQRVDPYYLPGWASTCSGGFVYFFLRVPQAVGLYYSCTADMLTKQARGTFKKHITKPSEQVAAPPSSRPASAVLMEII